MISAGLHQSLKSKNLKAEVIKIVKKTIITKWHIWVIICIVIIILTLGWNYLDSKRVSEISEFEEPTKPSTTLKLTPEKLNTIIEEEEKQPEAIGGPVGKTKVGNIIINPSKIKAGEFITIKVGEPSGSKGYENKIKFYPVGKNLRLAETSACGKSFCYAGFEKKYKTIYNLESGNYLVKIYDRSLGEYIYGYFIITT